MITWSDTVDIYLHRDPVDFRKSINGLVVIVEDCMAPAACSGALFVFCNKSRDKLKALYWDRTGFALWYKRLEKEKFKWPVAYLFLIVVFTELFVVGFVKI